ncbi:FG-GAP repeat protein [Haliangium sp.]|uniref:FG-GAP repeat protein n=1 Tax=Haliangium sp. TaxID=2663208 RepID=UPI003D0F6A79
MKTTSLAALATALILAACHEPTESPPPPTTAAVSTALAAQELGYVFPADVAVGDSFGRGVAVQGDMLIAGAYGSELGGNGSGAAYSFVRVGDNWVEEALLLPATVGPSDGFGEAIALDGDTVAIGARGDGAQAGYNEGSVYIYERVGGAWVESGKLVSPTPVRNGNFGLRMALVGDTLLLGANGENAGAGQVYVYERDPSAAEGWRQTEILRNPDGVDGDGFGYPVAFDGTVAVIGSPGRDSSAALNSGAAYVFRRNGGVWSLEAELTPTDPHVGLEFSTHAVAVDGDTVVVGDYGNETLYDNDGAAYVYTHDGASWSLQAKLTAADLEHIASFGWAVDIQGNRLAVSAKNVTGSTLRSGAVYLFEREGTTWTQVDKIFTNNATAYENFGYFIDLDGDQLAVSCFGDNVAAEYGGAVYFFGLSTNDDCPGAPGDGEYCTPECPCVHGEGDCDEDADCAGDTFCLHDVGLAFGYDDPDLDVCSESCPQVGNGGGNFCTPECPCVHGEGDCDSDADCAGNYICLRDVGLAFGFSDPEIDVCSYVCPIVGVGAGNYCFEECPCNYGEGDCDDDDDCAPGLFCAQNVGASFGFDADTDVCIVP